MTAQSFEQQLAAKDAHIAELRYALACARDTDNIFDLIRICDDALAIDRDERALIRHDINWIRQIDRLKNDLLQMRKANACEANAL